jgi:hypothetical protein
VAGKQGIYGRLASRAALSSRQIRVEAGVSDAICLIVQRCLPLSPDSDARTCPLGIFALSATIAYSGDMAGLRERMKNPSPSF